MKKLNLTLGHLRSKRNVPSAVVACVLLLLFCAGAAAQQKPPRIAVIMADPPGSDPRVDALKQGLRELGYVDQKNLTIDYRYAEGKEDRLQKIVAEVIKSNVYIIVTDGTAVTRAAKSATKTIPIVMASDGDPVGNKFVDSLARPGGNITGLTNLLAGISGKRMEILKDSLPEVSRFGILYNPDNPASRTGLKETQAAAQSLSIQLQQLEVKEPNDYPIAFGAASKGRLGGVSVVSDSVMFAHRSRLLDLAVKHKIPTMHTQSLWVQSGAIMSYGAYFPELYRRAAYYVDKILKGAKPADLPIEQPTTFELVINLRTARALGLTIPPSVLLRADQVIE